MNIFAMSDLHLSFSVENKEMDKFGAAWENHHIKIQENWSKLVSSQDLVLVPGDISWAMTLEDALRDLYWIDKLPGRKILIKGNHDYWWASLKKMEKLPESIMVLQHSAFSPCKGFAIAGTRGWLCPDDPTFTSKDLPIYKRELLRLRMSLEDARAKAGEGCEIICAMHFPPSTFSDGKSEFIDILKEYDVKNVIYGHLHGGVWQNRGPQGNIDGINYNLVSFDRLNGIPQLVKNLAL